MPNVLPHLKKIWKPLVAITGFGVMIIYAGGLLHEKTAPGQVEVISGSPVPGDARVIEAVARQESPRIDVVGTVQSDQRIEVRARLHAQIIEVLVRAGDRVRANQTLVLMDDRELREQLAGAEAQFRQAEAELNRTRQLFERNATTSQAMTAAQAAYDAAQANVERIHVMLSYAVVTSPIDGKITELRVEAGDFATAGQSLLGIFDPARMQLEIPVPIRLIHSFAPGRTFEARLEYPARTYPAEVTEIVGEIDPATRTRRVKLRLHQTGDDLLPGTFGSIPVQEESRPAIFIPASAIMRVGQLDMVHVVQGDRMIRRLVKTGPGPGDDVEVRSGLQGGERVVLPFVAED